MVTALLGEQLSNISLGSIRNMVLTSGFLLLLASYFYSKKFQRLRLAYVLYAASMALLAVYFMITTLLEGIYVTLLLVGVVIFSAGVFQTFVVSPPPATQKRLIIGLILLIIAGFVLIISHALLLEQIR
jgi:hypothetical protein